MADQPAPWPKQGPASYFPSIEKKYGRSIAEWQKIIDDCGLEKHMAIVGHLKSEYEMGHGHANALVGWTLSGNTAAPSITSKADEPTLGWAPKATAPAGVPGEGRVPSG